MNNEKISIIVPMYNMEKLIDKCIKSILTQDYKNFELILVDDGSTDKTKEICEKYKVKDKRIKLIIQKNGGVSSARNTGLRNVTGKYISFVDPDDYISSDFLSNLYNLLVQYGADISMIGFKSYYDKDVVFKRGNKYIEFSNIEALNKLIFEDIFTSHLWNKLYKKQLFDNIIFPENKIYEDIAIIYKVINRANKIIYNDSINYAYYQRPNSLTNKFSKKRLIDYMDAINGRYEFLVKNYPQYKKHYRASRIYSSLIFHYVIAKSNDIELYNDKILVDDYNKNVKLIFNKSWKLKYILALLILKFNRKIFFKIFKSGD